MITLLQSLQRYAIYTLHDDLKLVCKNIKAIPIIKDYKEKSKKICNKETFTDIKPLFTDFA